MKKIVFFLWVGWVGWGRWREGEGGLYEGTVEGEERTKIRGALAGNTEAFTGAR